MAKRLTIIRLKGNHDELLRNTLRGGLGVPPTGEHYEVVDHQQAS